MAAAHAPMLAIATSLYARGEFRYGSLPTGNLPAIPTLTRV